MPELEELQESGEFEEKVLKSDIPVIVYFGAAWCHPCKALKPILTKLQEEAGGKYKIVAADVEACSVLATEQAVTSVPTCLVFKAGVLTGRLIGLVTAERVLATLK